MREHEWSDDGIRSYISVDNLRNTPHERIFGQWLLDARKRIAELERERDQLKAEHGMMKAERDAGRQPERLQADLRELDMYTHAGNVSGVRAVACRIACRPCFCGMHTSTLDAFDKEQGRGR